ncbi:MAG: S-adenosylmethionine:tRNA ribosyltransferase-isomerase, partial [Planctomycetes bacterium]|nr:S-adenosylmethionine:tRNA ribosyltransferase-isomerase [Planctomycetota bacterium]
MKSTNDYHYELPEDLIAQHPLEQRDQSRLMVMDRQCLDIAHYQFFELPQWLHSGDCLVLNDTRVLSARLI